MSKQPTIILDSRIDIRPDLAALRAAWPEVEKLAYKGAESPDKFGYLYDPTAVGMIEGFKMLLNGDAP